MSKATDVAKEIADLKARNKELEEENQQLKADNKNIIDIFIGKLQSRQVPLKNIAYLLSWTEENLKIYLEMTTQEAQEEP